MYPYGLLYPTVCVILTQMLPETVVALGDSMLCSYCIYVCM